jgi:uncharacterized protein
MGDFHALDPFFRIIEQGLAEFVDGDHFVDLLAQDVVVDFIITVPNYPRHIVGRDNLIELYRGYGSTLFLDRCYDLRVHHWPSTSSVVLEYSYEGRVVATWQPYSNRYISVAVIKDRKVTAGRVMSIALADLLGRRTSIGGQINSGFRIRDGGYDVCLVDICSGGSLGDLDAPVSGRRRGLHRADMANR